MFERQLVTRSASVAAILSSLGGAALTLAARQTGRLPHPPGVRLVALPRAPDDKPQEVSVAVDPRDPKQVVVSYHQAISEGSDHHPGVPINTHVAWSADGGQTWTVAPGTTDRRYRKPFDAMVTFDRHGHAFLVYIGMDQVSMTTRGGEFVRRSLDGGRTWEAPITLIKRPGGQQPVMEHFPNIVADNDVSSPYAGSLYVAWDRILDPGKSEEMVFVRSTDDGKTWSPPKVIGKYDAGVAHTLAAGHDGTVYLMYALLAEGHREVMLMASHDRGQTFEAPRPVVKIPAAKSRANSWEVDNFPRPGGWPLMTIDPRGSPGRLFVVWGDYRNGDRDLFATTSGDGGRTWTPAVRVNDDPKSNGKDQVMQWLAVDPADGAAYVLFYDRRNDPKNLKPTVTLARSTDGGRTWVNYAWSDTASDPKAASFGDYIGLAAQDGRVYGAWVENAPTPQRAPGPQKPRPKAAPGEMEVDDADWPSGPSAIRIGIADFRTAAAATRQGARQR